MSARSLSGAAEQTREERMEGIIKELRPKIDAAVRPDGGAGRGTCRRRRSSEPSTSSSATAGQKLANDVRQASVASRKKKGLRRV